MSADPPQNRAFPLLLIDIDGVISLWGWPGNAPPDTVWTLLDGTAHALSAGAARRLAALGDRYELVWASGWEERADEHLPHLVGLGPLPHLSFDRAMAGAASRAHWKLAAIDAHAGRDRPLAWVDDAFNPACHAWAAARPGPTLLVPTDPAVGFTEPQAAQLRAWAGTLR